MLTRTICVLRLRPSPPPTTGCLLKNLCFALVLGLTAGGVIPSAQSAAPTTDRDHTPPRFLRYLAESGTGQAFQGRIALTNPGPRSAHILLTFLKSEGAPVLTSLELGPTSRTTIYPETIAGLAATEFSTTIESDEQVLVDRTTSRDGRAYSSHAEGSVAASSKTWYFAEGATHSGSNLYYVIQNRTTTAADVVVRFLLAAPRTSISKTYSVAPMSRRTIWVNDEARTDPNLAALAAVDVSAAMTATVPVVVERQVFADRNGQSFAVGHGSPGAPAAAPDWFFAEGATGSFYDM